MKRNRRCWGSTADAQTHLGLGREVHGSVFDLRLLVLTELPRDFKLRGDRDEIEEARSEERVSEE